MADLTMRYMGIALKNPLISSASPLSEDLDKIREAEEAGASAVILHSLFEEQVTLEERTLNRFLLEGTESFPEALTYFPDLGDYKFSPDEYLQHVSAAKAAVDIPIIGSLNGVSTGGWIRYARAIEDAGADAIELNIYYLPANPDLTSEEVERNYRELVREVVNSVSVPVAVKLGPYLSSIPNMAKSLAGAGARGLVLFNRFYQPDIDLDVLKVVPNLNLSSPEELRLRIRWVAIMYGKVGVDFAITGGVHSAGDVIKCILVGASAAMMTSAILKNGIGHFKNVLEGVNAWLEKKGYDSASGISGMMSQRSAAEPAAFERANYMKVLGSYS
jgi:dihydroorotate dehydrogenase (fumarate)